MLLKNRSVAILFFGLFVAMMGFGIIIPVLPMYAKSLGATSLHLGMIMATFSFFQFIFAPIWGTVSDRIGRKPVLMIGLVGYMLSHLVNGFASSVAMLFVSRVLGGILSSAVLPTAMAFISDVTGEHERGAGMGIFGAAMGAGVIFGPAIGGSVSHFTNSFQAPFFVAAGLVALLIPLAWAYLPESLPRERRVTGTREKKPHRLRELANALRSELAIYFVIAFLTSFAAANLEGIFAYFSLDRFGFGPREMGLVFTVIGVVSVLMQGLLVGPAINRYGENRLILAGLVGTAIGFILLTQSWNLVSLTVFVALNMAGGSLVRPGLSSAVSKQTDAGQGATMGVVSSFDSLGRIVGPVLAGWLYGLHINLPFFFGAGIVLVGALIALPAFRHPRPTIVPAPEPVD
ncbi:MFS transporter [candidate division WOR-3 bacterium]|uniref:MFS transporter n=1 Tax=candidate division WOR-3 bacterium TaxID=2052148 RepID=A0A937XE25_UNCW3|nr:MFS transporter [candidate division WOR-3 bacterium]